MYSAKNETKQPTLTKNYSKNENNRQSSIVSLDAEHPTITQLKAIGYKVGDRVTVRCIPFDKEKHAINLEGYLTTDNLDLWTLRVSGKDSEGKKVWKRHKHKQDGLSYLHSVNEQGYGVYFNVNGGRTNAEVNRVTASIFECDFGSLDEQRKLINALGIKPSLTVWSGGKSIHTYFCIAPQDAKKFEQWKHTQQVIGLATASDPALKDYTRLLRLAGFKHQKTGNIATIEQLNDVGYRLSDIEQSFSDRYPYSDERFKLYQYLTGLQSSQKYDFGIDAKIVYSFSDSNLTLELERYKRYFKVFKDGYIEEAKAILNAPYSEIRKAKKERKQQERTLDANLSQVSNNTGFGSIYQYFANKYATGFHDGGAEYYKCRCPVHEGNSNDSLHLKKDSDFLKCHGGCDTEDVKRELRDRAIKAGDPLAYNKFKPDPKELGELQQIDLEINQKRLEDLTVPNDKNVVFLWSEKATGKSHWMKTYPVPEALKDDLAILGITHRIQLSRGMATNFGIDYVDNLENQNYPQYALVINSLHEFSKAGFSTDCLDGFDGAYIFFDEFEQMLWELLNGDLMEDKRALILNNVKYLIDHVVSTGGKIFLADADLGQVSYDFIKGCISNQSQFNPFVVKNLYQPHKEMGTDLYMFADSDPKSWLSALTKCFHAKKPVLVHLSAQKVNSDYGSKTLESLVKNKYKNVRILRVDSETISDPNHPANQFVSRIYNDPSILYQYDVIVTTPVLETGVSIDDFEQHFSAIFGCFRGQQSPNTVSQTLFRHRGSIPRFVWVNPYPNMAVGNGSTNPLELLQDQSNKAEKIISQLTKAGLLAVDDINLLSNFDNLFLRTWATMGAKLNQQYKNYFVSCSDRLKKDGYKVHIVDGSDLQAENSVISKALGLDGFLGNNIVSGMVRNERDVNKSKHYKKIASMPNPSDDEYEKISNKNEPSPEDKQRKYRGYFERFYGVEPTEQLVQADLENNLAKKWQLYYYLTKGAEFLPQKEAKAIKGLKQSMNSKYVTYENNQLLATDVVKKSKTLRVDQINEVGIKQFLDAPDSARWTQDDLEDWLESWKANKKRFYELTGLWLTDKSRPIAIANELLDRIDCQLARDKRLATDGRKWTYRFYSYKYVYKKTKEKVLKHWYDEDYSQFTSQSSNKQDGNNIGDRVTYFGQNTDHAGDKGDFLPQKSPAKITKEQNPEAVASAENETNPYLKVRRVVETLRKKYKAPLLSWLEPILKMESAEIASHIDYMQDVGIVDGQVILEVKSKDQLISRKDRLIQFLRNHPNKVFRPAQLTEKVYGFFTSEMREFLRTNEEVTYFGEDRYGIVG